MNSRPRIDRPRSGKYSVGRLALAIQAAEKAAIEQALAENNQSRTYAAMALEICRRTLLLKIAFYKIEGKPARQGRSARVNVVTHAEGAGV